MHYRHFINNFAEITKCNVNVNFEWRNECQKSFEILKKKLVNSSILQYPNFEKPFGLRTDSSNYALEIILLQGEIGENLPIPYASKAL